MSHGPEKIVFFDGDCGICNYFVQFCLRFRKADDLYFAPLGGETARQRLPPAMMSDLSTVVLVDGNNPIKTHSDAVIKIARGLRAPANLLQYLWVIPRPIRDFGYRFIAARRHRITVGSSCDVPTQKERELFLP